MLLTVNPNQNLIIEGTDQQDFNEVQLVQGAFPYQQGMQRKVPGKSLQRVVDGPIGSIYVFYMVYGRSYLMVDYGDISIEPFDPPVDPPPIYPPAATMWFDTFGTYEEGTVSRIWGGGPWPDAPGICESIIDGLIDPFLVYAIEDYPPGRPPDPFFPPVVNENDDDPEIETPVVLEVPSEDYDSYSLSAVFTDFYRYGCSNTLIAVDYPAESEAAWIARGITPQQFEPVVYDTLYSSTPGVLQGNIEHEAFVGYNSVSWNLYGFSRSFITDTYMGRATLNFLELGELPAGTQAFLIGKTTRTDNAGVEHDVVETLNVTMYINVRPPQVFFILPIPGASKYTNPDGDYGLLGQSLTSRGFKEWTEVRIYYPGVS